MRRAGRISVLTGIGLLELIVVLAIALVIPLLVPERHQPTPPVTATTPSEVEKQLNVLTQQEAGLREHFEHLDKEIAHLEQSVVIMLAFSTLAVAVLFGSILFGEYRINRAAEDLESRAEEAKRRFPTLAEFEEMLRNALDDYREAFREDEWVEDRYRDLSIELRQHILTVERLFPLQFKDVTASQLRGLANFFFSKYNTEHVESDLDRALYYADLACKRNNGGFQYKNDLGFIYMDLARRDVEYREKAERALLDSKRNHASQQRCYYNLGLIYYEEATIAHTQGDSTTARNKFSQACDALRIALKHQDWESKPNPRMTSAVHYNLACFLCRLAAEDSVPPQGRSKIFDEIVHHLEEAAQFNQTKLKTVEDDLGLKEGDLAYLASNRSYDSKVENILADFRRIWKA